MAKTNNKHSFFPEIKQKIRWVTFYLKAMAYRELNVPGIYTEDFNQMCFHNHCWKQDMFFVCLFFVTSFTLTTKNRETVGKKMLNLPKSQTLRTLDVTDDF